MFYGGKTRRHYSKQRRDFPISLLWKPHVRKNSNEISVWIKKMDPKAQGKQPETQLVEDEAPLE